MKSFRKSVFFGPLATIVMMALMIVATAAGPAEAMFIPAPPAVHPAVSAERTADLAKIQTTLESKVVQQRLQDYGLTPDEAMTRMSRLTDEQIHQLAGNADSIQAGGDAVDLFVGVIVVALLVVLLIWLVQGKIVVR